MRRFVTTTELEALGLTRAAIRWAVKQGRWRHAGHGVYGEGPEPLSALERAVAPGVASGGVASGRVAGQLLRLDSVFAGGPDFTVPPGHSNSRRGARRRLIADERIVEVEGVRCTDGLQTLIDLAAELDDDTWEQALESALRKRIATIAGLAPCGDKRIERVLALRPPGAPATESLLETLMVQLARRVPNLPPPTRQLEVYDAHGEFVARVDLAWPALGLFIELDGQHHKDQPVYDARRETAVVAATGWLCGRFTWREVHDLPVTTARRLAEVVTQAQARPVSA